MKRVLLPITVAAAYASALPAFANDRYVERPPVVVSPDLSAPWIMQLGNQPGRILSRQKAFPDAAEPRRSATREVVRERVVPKRVYGERASQPPVRTVSVAPAETRAARRELNPVYLPQEVAYDGRETPGTIIIDTTQNFLFLVGEGGKARRYGVGTGKPGFEWAGTHKVTRKAEWPDWRPPAEMIARERVKGRELPAFVAGGPQNPLGARALYLGSTLYRIHGTNQPWTIGQAVSSGCIRMRNEDVVDLYERVRVVTKVLVI